MPLLADEVIVGGWVQDLRDGSPLEVRISDQFQLFRGTFTRGARVLFTHVGPCDVARAPKARPPHGLRSCAQPQHQ
jgi:hypothetical protein